MLWSQHATRRTARAGAVALALGWIAAPVRPALAQAGETVAAPVLGLKVVKPAGWLTLTAEGNAENLKRVFEDDPEFQAMLARHASAPVIAFTKYAEPYEDLNPSFKINARPMGPLAGQSASSIIVLILPTLARTMPDMVVEQPPVETTVGGRAAGYLRVHYVLKAGTLSVPTTSELWIVPLKSYFLMIGAGTRTDEANGTRAEIRQIVDSLTVDP